MVGHQIVVSKNKAPRRVRGIANLSGFSAELMVRRSCCWKGHRNIKILKYLLQFNGTYNLLLTYILTLIDNNTKE